MAIRNPQLLIEESDDDLEKDEVRPFEFWVAKQRELVPNVVDYNLESLANLVLHGIIDLKPQYQRRQRWNAARQSKLIESFLMNVPVPPIFLNEDEFGKYSVIDGKQRLTAISEFMRGSLRLTNLEIFSEINGKRLDELHPRFQNVIKTRPTLRAVIILKMSDPDIKYQVFQRLNTGGVKLNAQEIRNSAYTGPFNDLILELSELAEFHTMLGTKDKTSSAIYQEMRDAELVCRFFTFRNQWSSFKGGIKTSMDQYSDVNRRMGPDELKSARSDFINTLRVVKAAFRDTAFRRWVPEKQIWRKAVLVALYDAQMFACYRLKPSDVEPVSAKLIEGVEKLFADPKFRLSVDAATNTPSYFIDRIKIMKAMINTTVGKQNASITRT